MRKRFIISLLLCFSIATTAFCYKDYIHGESQAFFAGMYTGDESISYLRSQIREMYINELHYSYIGPIRKFSKIEKSLLDGALSDYEANPGEIYTVCVFVSGSTDFFIAVVLIDAVLNDGNLRYTYWDAGRYFRKLTQ